MAEAYENVYVKWLKGQNGSSSNAPFLVDDDEDEEHRHGDYSKNHETGPPVLKPESYHPPNVSDVASGESSKQFTFSPSQPGISYQTHRSLEKPVKTYSAYGNTHKRKKQEAESQVSMNSNSGNIFDKFNQYHEDKPPSLILSPEAEDQQEPPQPKKYAVKSPDFCAMEADSTSELQRFHKGQENLDKVGSSEISLECDSTCMLGGSPSIVSPASNSTSGDTDEPIDCLKLHKTVEIQCNADSLDEKPYVPAKAEAPDIVSDLKPGRRRNGSDSPTTEASVGDGDRVSFCAEKRSTFLEDKSVGVNLTSGDCVLDSMDDSPSLASGGFIASQHMRRKQRHTVDCAEGFSKSMKMCVDEAPTLNAYGPPPFLTINESENVVATRNKSQRKKAKSSGIPKKRDPSKIKRPSYRRSNTVPVANSQRNMSHSVQAIWQLSQLQTQMQALLSQLWPKLPLNHMCPESPRFTDLLSDLITVLEKPEVEQRPNSSMPFISTETPAGDITHSPTPFSKGNRSSQNREHLPQGTTGVDHCNKDQENVSSHHTTETTLNPSLNSTSQNSHALERLPPVLDHVCSQNSSPTWAQSFEQNHRQQQVEGALVSEAQLTPMQSIESSSADTCVPQTSLASSDCPHLDLSLSQLCLEDGTEVCVKPVRVVLPKDPESDLAFFCETACRALQLLLPDVPVSLSNELASNPQALCAFIDNVCSVNVKGSHKKRF
ncbi:hypothetical protein PoB_003721700 [Plakobranchus ocellatus]|uniref:Uncharacterized protein n=1 Tax=Plakobranchus ocellatus TaxID=259542 RepID=A0AAV4AUS9_9GAST|nr:hypothetical protein PoB_003721700 [Plakobranchus ocellatus]